MKKCVVIPEVIHHKPVYVQVTDTTEYYPPNAKWPPDPAIYGEPQAFDCRELDRGMGR